ncbi:hypothetical protein MMC34_008712 [Xylographa carneopallida]|nr:hypothetical protein [Xylographa carneopallida]
MADTVPGEDSMPQPEDSEVAEDEQQQQQQQQQQSIAAEGAEVEGSDEQPSADTEAAADGASEAAAADEEQPASEEQTTEEPAADVEANSDSQSEMAADGEQPAAVDGEESDQQSRALLDEETDTLAAGKATAAAEGSAAEAVAVESGAGASVDGEEEPGQMQSAVSLKVDTAAEDEAEADISTVEPVDQPPQAEQPADKPTVRTSLFGLQHNWCPLCSRQGQQAVDSAEGREQQSGASNSDALSLSWAEQSLFACGAEHHSNIVAFKSLLPPASSLPPFIPPSIAVIGPPLSGRTSLAKRLCSSLGLTYLSIPDIFASLHSASHALSAQLSASLPSPPTLSLTLDCVEAALCQLAEAHEATRGWLLDGYPNTRAEAEALQQRGLLPRQCINLTCVKRGGQQAEVAEVDRRWRARDEKEQAAREEQERLAVEMAAAAAQEEKRVKKEKEEAAADAGGEEGEEADAEEAQHTEHDATAVVELPDAAADGVETANGEEQDDAESEVEQAAAGGSDDLEEASKEASVASAPMEKPGVSAEAPVLQLHMAVNANGKVMADIRLVPVTPPTPIDLLAPFIASMRRTLTAEQWSEQAPAFQQLLDHLRSGRLLTTLAVPTSLWSAHRQASEAVAAYAAARMAHLQALFAALPSSLSSLPFPSARLASDLSPFGLYSAVSWRDRAALHKLQPDAVTTRWVQYKGVLYALCDEQQEQQFTADSARYHSSSTFPAELPLPFSDDGGTGQLAYPLRYAGYCPVSIQQQQAGEVLYVQPGKSQHSALFQSRLYRCSSAAALQLFLTFPSRYSGLSLPSPLPLPLHLQPLPLAPDAVHSFLLSNFDARLASCLSALSAQRHALLYPGLSVQQSALLHLALQLRGDAARLQAFEAECRLGREIAAETADANGAGSESERHATYDAIIAEVADADGARLEQYVERRFFPLVRAV